jgi:hypothetical protein
MLLMAVIVQIVAGAMEKRPARAAFRPRVAPLAGDPLADDGGEQPPPMGSAVGSLAVIAVVGFVLARQLLKR